MYMMSYFCKHFSQKCSKPQELDCVSSDSQYDISVDSCANHTCHFAGKCFTDKIYTFVVTLIGMCH